MFNRKTHLQWSQMGWLSLDRRYEWDTRLWPILRRVKTVSSRRHNDVCGSFMPSTGLIENSLFVGMLSHESCHSFMHSLDICGKKLSGGILPWVMTALIPYTAPECSNHSATRAGQVQGYRRKICCKSSQCNLAWWLSSLKISKWCSHINRFSSFEYSF